MTVNPFFLKNKNNLVIVGVIIVSLFVAKRANDMHTQRCNQLTEQIKTEEEKGTTLERIVVLNEKLKKLRERSWEATDFEAVVQRVSSLAQASNVKIFSLMPGDKKDNDTYISVAFSLTGEATFRNYMKFLKALENEKKLLRLKDMTLAPQGQQNSSNEDVPLSINISGEAIYFK